MPAYFAQMSSGDVWGRDGVAVVEVLTLFWTSSGASGAGGGGELHYLNARLAVQTCPAASDPRVGWGALKLLGGTSQALTPPSRTRISRSGCGRAGQGIAVLSVVLVWS